MGGESNAPSFRVVRMTNIKDFGLSAAQLDAKYERRGEHPDYAHREWRLAVASQSTESGYWVWVEQQLADEQCELDEDNPYTQWALS